MVLNDHYFTLQGQGKHLQIVSLRPKGGGELGIKTIVGCLHPPNILLMDEIHWEEKLEQVPPAILTYPQQRQEKSNLGPWKCSWNINH